MKSFLLSTTFAFLALPALAGSVTEAIEARSLEFEAAFNAGDSAAVGALYAPDAAILPPGGARVDGRDEITAFWAAAIESGLADLDLVAAEVIATGDSALDVGTLTLSAPGEGSARTTVAGKYVVHWVQIDGAWHLHRDIWNLGQ
jgi:uncharacterized protein (TIGR02246 family)